VGLRQLETAATKGELTQTEARYNMAKSLRNYDHDYTRALAAALPLTTEFPENPLFLLMAGILPQTRHNDEAVMRFRAAAAAPMETPCVRSACGKLPGSAGALGAPSE